MENMEKRCPRCGELKYLEEFHLDNSNKNGHCWRCKVCANESQREYDYKNGGRPMSENIECPHYLGSFVNETLLHSLFTDSIRMEYGHPGYDLRCGSGYRIDAKSSVLHDRGSGIWTFYINKNINTDYFMLVAYDDRVNLNIMHMWIFPSSVLNDKKCFGISVSTVNRWTEWEMPTGQAQATLDLLRSNGEI